MDQLSFEKAATNPIKPNPLWAQAIITESRDVTTKSTDSRKLWVAFTIKEARYVKFMQFKDVSIVMFQTSLYFQEIVVKENKEIGFAFKKLTEQFIANTKDLHHASIAYARSTFEDDHPDFMMLKIEYERLWITKS